MLFVYKVNSTRGHNRVPRRHSSFLGAQHLRQLDATALFILRVILICAPNPEQEPTFTKRSIVHSGLNTSRNVRAAHATTTMMRKSPMNSQQKCYDECYLICSTAIYFEGQVRDFTASFC